ncbi:MAG: Mo-dependent nitrogenase C-terminal domain-containing protein [Crocosphaera sp.]
MFYFPGNQPRSQARIGLNQDKAQDYWVPLRQWLNNREIRNESIAHFLCRLIPVQCPFERDIYILGQKICHIPPLCKLNPLYEEVVALRFRALCYLADECNQDISCYC